MRRMYMKRATTYSASARFCTQSKGDSGVNTGNLKPGSVHTAVQPLMSAPVTFVMLILFVPAVEYC